MKGPPFELPNAHTLPMGVSLDTAQAEWLDLVPGADDSRVIEAYRLRYEFLAAQQNVAPPCMDKPARPAPPKPAPAQPKPGAPLQKTKPREPKPAPAPEPKASPEQLAKQIGARLREARAAAGWAGENWERLKTRFAESAGVSGFMVNKAEGGVLSKPYMKKVCAFLHINRAWLDTGAGEMFTEEPPHPEAEKAPPPVEPASPNIAMFPEARASEPDTLETAIAEIGEVAKEAAVAKAWLRVAEMNLEALLE